jgi:allantoinase
MKQTDDIWAAWGGLGGVQSLLPALLSEGVHRRGMSVSDVVRLTSAAPARRLGLFPRKGALDVGSDADLALVDLEASWTLRGDDLETRWPVNPFVGREFQGRVVSTLVRGTVVWGDGAAQVRPGFGQLVSV